MNKIAYAALFFLGFLVQGDNTVVSPVLPEIASDLEISISLAALAVTGYLLPFGIFALFQGPAADLFGKTRIITIAGFGTAIFSAASGLAFSLPLLIFLRAVNGFFASGIIPITVSFIGNNWKGEEKQNRIGAYLGFTFLGQATGTAIGGGLTQFISWRIVFFLYGGLELIAGLLILFKLLPEKTAANRDKNIVYAELLKNWQLLIIIPLIIINGFIVYGAFAFMGAHLEEVLAFNYLQIGLILSFFGLAAYSVGQKSGWLRSYLKKKYFPLFGILGFIALTVYTYIGAHSSLFLMLALIGFGGTFIAFQSAFITAAQNQAPEHTGTVMALVAFSLFGGGGIGTLVNRQLLALGGYNYIFLLAALLYMILGFASKYFIDDNVE